MQTLLVARLAVSCMEGRTHKSKDLFHTGLSVLRATDVKHACSPSMTTTASGPGRLNNSRFARPVAPRLTELINNTEEWVSFIACSESLHLGQHHHTQQAYTATRCSPSHSACNLIFGPTWSCITTSSMCEADSHAQCYVHTKNKHTITCELLRPVQLQSSG